MALTNGIRSPGAALAATGLALILSATIAMAAPKVGAPAPDFTGVDSTGKTVKLSDFKGKTVVLEWTNHGCPYVQKHYGSGNMQKLQKTTAADGVVWLSVVSSAPGRQGHVDGKAADKLTQSRGAKPTAVLLDPEGMIGKLYGARATPHMFVIKQDGTLGLYGRDRRQTVGESGRRQIGGQLRDQGPRPDCVRQGGRPGRDPGLRLLGEIRVVGRRGSGRHILKSQLPSWGIFCLAVLFALRAAPPAGRRNAPARVRALGCHTETL